MADYLPAFDGGTLTFTASADVAGGRAVELTDDREVAIAGAASTAYIGVAAFSAASGEKVTVHLPGKVQRLRSAAAIAAGVAVECGANGTVRAGTGPAPLVAPMGIALTAATDADEIILVLDHLAYVTLTHTHA